MNKTVRLTIVMSAPGPIIGCAILLLLLAGTVPALAQIPDTLFASDGAHADRFGFSVDIDGDVAVVGATNANGGTGSAYVFRYDGSRWNEEAILTAPDGAAMDLFGYAVAVSGDNIVVGAPMKDDRVGGAYAFRYLASEWTTYQVLVPPVDTWPTTFGWSVDIDGDRLAIGAPGDGENGASSGAAFVFTFTGPSWLPDAKVTASDGDLSDFLGTSLALGPDLLAVGAYGDDQRTGAVYVYTPNGSEWTENDKLVASDGSLFEDFGFDVDFSEESKLIVGARYATGAADKSGAAYLFEFSGTQWSEVAKLEASNGNTNHSFGTQVAINGTVAAVSAPSAPILGSAKSGVVYLYRLENQDWMEKNILLAPDQSQFNNTSYGFSIAAQGDEVVVGAMSADNSDGVASGAAFVYGLGLQSVGVDHPEVVSEFRLVQNYPNPFNPTTTIAYALARPAEVTLTVCNVLGRQVRMLASGVQPTGAYEVSFDAAGLPSGVYIYRLTAADYVETKRMVVVK